MTDKEIYESQEDVISNRRVYGISESMVASGYPMLSNTGDDFDTYYQVRAINTYFNVEKNEENYDYVRELFPENAVLTLDEVKKEINRSKKLGKAPLGSGHDNYLNGIVTQFDLTFTIKAWTEAERYHFFDFVSSQSTLHRLQKMEIAKSCIKYVDSSVIDVVEKLVKEYTANPTLENRLKMLYSCPTGLKLTARMTTNYRQLKTIYHQRKNHALPEWRKFCQQLVDEFPMFKELCLGDDE